MTTVLNLLTGKAWLRVGKKMSENTQLKSGIALGSVLCQSTNANLLCPLTFSETD